MVMKTHSPNDTGKGYLTGILRPKYLLVFCSVSLCVITGLNAQEKTIRPDDLACPVTANLFPEQIRRIDFIRFIFRGGIAFPRRISIALIHPQNNDISIEYRWVGTRVTRTGILVANGEGKTNCFFLRYEAISEDDRCKEFILFIPENIRVNEIAFSDLRSEKPQVLCPMPKIEQDITDAYMDCRQNPEDKEKALVFIRLLERITPKYDCRRPFDHKPVPAWWLASSRIYEEGWIEWLYRKTLEKNGDAFRVYAKFLATSSGAIAENMSEEMWGILHDQPLFVLENWTGIEDNKEWVLMCMPWPLQGNTEISKMIEIYRDIARKEPNYKSACDEIISILIEKSQEEWTSTLRR